MWKNTPLREYFILNWWFPAPHARIMTVFQKEHFNTGYILGNPLAVADQEITEFLKQNFLLQKYNGISLDPCVGIILTSKCLETLLGCGVCPSDQSRAGSKSGNPKAGDQVPEMCFCSGRDAPVPTVSHGSSSSHPLLVYMNSGWINQSDFGNPRSARF